MVVVDRSPGLTHAYWPAETSEPVLEQTIGTALRAAAETHGARTALLEGTVDADRRRWTFVELLATSEKVARALLTRFSRGEHVAIWAANCPGWVLIEFGGSPLSAEGDPSAYVLALSGLAFLLGSAGVIRDKSCREGGYGPR